MNGFITSSSGSLISYEASTPEICKIDQDLFLSFQKIGKCTVIATAAEKIGYKKPTPIELNFSINKSSTITCIKGKVTKKITGVSPVCPSGYKKKK
jgi:hypothetical protein